MGKGKGFTFTLFAALGAIAGYATYMASKDGFSDNTKEKVDTVLDKVQNVGTDIKRTYTSIGDKEAFQNRTKNLGNSSLNLAKKTGDLIASGASDMYKFAKNQISTYIEKNNDDDTNYDDLDTNYVASKGGKKKSIKVNTKKNVKNSSKKTTKKTKK